MLLRKFRDRLGIFMRREKKETQNVFWNIVRWNGLYLTLHFLPLRNFNRNPSLLLHKHTLYSYIQRVCESIHITVIYVCMQYNMMVILLRLSPHSCHKQWKTEHSCLCLCGYACMERETERERKRNRKTRRGEQLEIK